MLGDDEGPGYTVAVAEVLTGCCGVNPDDVSGAKPMMLVCECYLKFAFKDVHELRTAKDLWGELALVAVGVKFGGAPCGGPG